ncbi:aspartic-type endopeptidase [Colletotrichum chrysophilum]|uniref:Aspartic-type endopeptidase n=1 Tax=Colletotrichum chrysophilum TaxID=1836956 RepID=A0AAD9AQH6_9PEZI|nr:aspartic-type endopeptidase [Colletotrichum chrysophilum]
MLSVDAGGNFRGSLSKNDAVRYISRGSQIDALNYWPTEYMIWSPWTSMWFNVLGLYLVDESLESYSSDFNMTIAEVHEWSHTYINVTSNVPVGILGLGRGIRESYEQARIDEGIPLGITDPLVKNKSITSNSCFMHLGSNLLNQAISLSFGGYEKNRALGRVATFRLSPYGAFPLAFLIDVALEVEYGGSPFPPGQQLGSVWDADNITNTQKDMVKMFSGPPGSLMVNPDAAFPYLYLPPSVCAAAAAYLPVYFHNDLGLYIWNETGESERVNRITLTVKIPFKLLYLNVSPQRNGSSADMRYWPCKPLDIEGLIMTSTDPISLGRAFLQGAFIGYNYDRKRFYMAQAPGPNVGQRVAVDDDAETLSSNPADYFADTWRRWWTGLDNTTSDDVSGSESSGDGTTTGRTPFGLTAGIVAGAIAGICGAIGGGWWYFRRHRRQAKGENAAAQSGDEYHALGGKPELDGDGVPIAELHPETAKREPQVLAELHSPSSRDELQVESMVYEMPAEDVLPNPTEQPASQEKKDQSPQKPLRDVE